MIEPIRETENVKLVIVKIVREYDELLPLFLNHLEDYQGEIIPHIFYADLTRLVLSLEAPVEWAEKLLGTLEKLFKNFSDEPTSNAIAVSFIEHLPTSPTDHWVIEKLGIKMKYQYDQFHGEKS